MPPLLVVCPSFPSPARASDGQSIYVVEAARALARLRGAPLEVMALRVGDEPEREAGDFFSVTRVAPARPVPSVLHLYEAGVFRPVFEGFARRVGARAASLPPGAVLWAHGYELGGALAAARRAGVPAAGVVHYLVADESEATLAGVDDPLRRSNLHPLVRAVAMLTPRPARRLAVRSAGQASPVALRAPGLPWLVRVQLEKLDAERRFFSSAAQVVAVGRSFAHTIERHYPDVHGRVRWCFAGAPEVRPAGPPRGAGALRLALIGRPTPQKGWDVFLEALKALEANAPDEARRVELHVIGAVPPPAGTHRGYLAHVAASLAALRLVRVTLHGALPRAGVLAVLGEVDVLAFPSIYEPFGLVMLEALSSGVALLTSDADGPRDVVTGELGRVVPFGVAPQRVPLLTEAVRELLALPEGRRAAMRAAARAKAASFSWEACARVHAEALAAAVQS
ncbi:MAG: glycosyltransferase family 4 protein [Myxococcaceae bacterium]|nr:glycosyltransferase family 4 protein [Myxococcaceae bacterium]MCA3013635.1 glycosyltransferase family 4 protein [Myxococcaceae bacterium]